MRGPSKDVIDEFARRFSCRAPAPTAERTIRTAETELGRAFPSTYRSALLRYGPLDCPDLIDAVVAADATLPVLQTLVDAARIRPETDAAAASGLNSGLFVFGLDPTGSLFCFRSQPDDDSVWLFDIDLGDTSQVAADLGSLLTRYLAL